MRIFSFVSFSPLPSSLGVLSAFAVKFSLSVGIRVCPRQKRPLPGNSQAIQTRFLHKLSIDMKPMLIAQIEPPQNIEGGDFYYRSYGPGRGSVCHQFDR